MAVILQAIDTLHASGLMTTQEKTLMNPLLILLLLIALAALSVPSPATDA